MNDELDLPPEPPRTGAVAHKSEAGWHVSVPGDALYSTALMVATHRWDAKSRIWINLELDFE